MTQRNIGMLTFRVCCVCEEPIPEEQESERCEGCDARAQRAAEGSLSLSIAQAFGKPSKTSSVRRRRRSR